MPFKNQKETPKRSFEEADAIIVTDIFPTLHWRTLGGNVKDIWLLPNCCLMYSHKGSMKEKNPLDFFVLCCRQHGLSYAEIGLWLDTCLDRSRIKNADGLTRIIDAEKWGILRFDQRKPIYFYDRIARSELYVATEN